MDSVSGPGALIAAADMIWITRRMADTSNFELINPKFRDGQLLDTTSFHFDATFESFKITSLKTAQANPLGRAILAHLSVNARRTMAQIQIALGDPMSKVRTAVEDLIQRNLVDSHEHGRIVFFTRVKE